MSNEIGILEKTVLGCFHDVRKIQGCPILFTGGHYTLFKKDFNDLGGLLELHSTPSAAFALVEGDFSISLVIQDITKTLTDWIKAHGKTVVLQKGQIVIERYVVENRETLLMNLLVYGHDLKVIEDEVMDICREIPVPEQSWMQRFCVLHVSTVFYDGVKPFCLVLVKLPRTDSMQYKKYLWLVFMGDDVGYRELLLPNREYVIVLPQGVEKTYFSKTKQLADVLDKAASRVREVLHHRDLFVTLDAVALPQFTALYLQSPSSLTSVPPGESLSWQSLSQGESSLKKIVSIYGIIKSVKHEKPKKIYGCALCKNENQCAKKAKTSYQAVNLDHWNNYLTVPEDVNGLGLQLPLPKKSDHFIFTSIVPDNLNIEIILEDKTSGDILTLYIKNWLHFIRPMALVPGQILVAMLVHRRFSQRGNFYYTTCSLSSFRILNNTSLHSSALETEEPWGSYGFPYCEMEVYKKAWGIMEMEKLIKVSIRAICNYCHSEYRSSACSSNICKDSTRYTSDATVVVHMFRSDGPVKILMKNEIARIYLGIDKSMWAKYCEVSSKYKLLYVCNDQEATSNGPKLQKYFSLYCRILRPRRVCFISVRALRTQPGDIPLHFCTNIEPITDFTTKRSKELSDQLEALKMKAEGKK